MHLQNFHNQKPVVDSETQFFPSLKLYLLYQKHEILTLIAKNLSMNILFQKHDDVIY